MSALDGTVTNVILPVVQQAFHTQVTTVEWIVVIYLLVVSGLLLTFGRLGDLRGHRQIYLAGFVVFVTGSALCGISPSAEALIAFRAFQALGAAMLFSNSPAILTGSFPASQRGQALGLQGMMTYLGLTVGPSLGGWLTQVFSWRAVFYINLPVGLAALTMSWLFVPQDQPKTHAEKFDIVGALLFMVGLVSLMLALNEGADWGWGSAVIIGLIGFALSSLAIFIAWELHVTAPMLDLRLFTNLVFNLSSTSAVLNYITLYSIVFLMPFYLIQSRGFSPSHAGLILTAQPILMAISAPLSGWFSDRIGTRIPATTGMIILAVGLFLLSRIGPNSSQGQIIIALAVCGLGTGLFVSPNNSALMGSAPRNRQGIASGILATARNVGMVLGIGISGAILTSYIARGGNSAISPAVETGFLVGCGVAICAAIASGLRGRA